MLGVRRRCECSFVIDAFEPRSQEFRVRSLIVDRSDASIVNESLTRSFAACETFFHAATSENNFGCVICSTISPIVRYVTVELNSTSPLNIL